jgi:hypothetical protein
MTMSECGHALFAALSLEELGRIPKSPDSLL